MQKTKGYLSVIKPLLSLSKHPSAKALFNIENDQTNSDVNTNNASESINENNQKENIEKFENTKLSIKIIKCDFKALDEKEVFYIEKNQDESYKFDNIYNFNTVNKNNNVKPLLYNDFTERQIALDYQITQMIQKGFSYKKIEQKLENDLKTGQ